MTTLAQFLASINSTLNPPSNSQLSDSAAISDVVTTIAHVGIKISELLRLGALADIHGEVGTDNIQGEAQKKLDVIANDMLLDALIKNTYCAGVASEELDHATPTNENGELLVLFDPLDGSSNIDINMPVGTIFSVLPYHNKGNTSTDDDFLQQGTQQLCAGYLLYGSSTILALTFNNHQFDNYDHGVVMFSLDPKTNDFVLIKDNIAIDADTKEYAINGSNYRHWLAPMQQYIDELLAGKTGNRDKNFNTRWVAAMVGDVHRILCRGGIFIYPFDTKDANKAGKLRLMYEANPMSLLIEQAGGLSTDATKRIMDYKPADIHQRVPVVLGSKNEVERVKVLHEQHEK